MTDLIKFDGGVPALSAEVISHIVQFETMAKQVKEQEDKLKAEILNAMELNGVVKIESPELVLTYVAATTRESLDTKGLRADFPEVYDAYAKISPVKASLRIKLV